jgi:hypothetical protein
MTVCIIRKKSSISHDMGFSTAGILVKNAAVLSDESVLEALGFEDHRRRAPISMEDASAGDSRVVAIGRLEDLAMVFAKELRYSCRVEGTRLSETEQRLRELSGKGDVLFFAIDSVSDTHAWEMFAAGELVAGRSSSDGKLLSSFGKVEPFDESGVPDEDAITGVIERFSGRFWIDLVYDARIAGTSFSK